VTARLEWRRATVAERALAVGGLALLIVTFLPWYDGPAGVSANAWDAFELLDLALLAVALLALAPFAVSTLDAAVPRQRLALTVLGAASATAVLVAYRLLNPPGVDDQGTSLGAGAWLGLLLTVGLVAAAHRASRDAERA
jgi:hypothetical protein